ncbi:YhcN/YlaJ family sporulation lipoprotein [Bacillus tuaregi]|uniref:YhcN/YlaJ family sporulation lipoprotein n=1 Tax=Bacillus tuaregi TaxID=1816695 RepID=UPI0008F7F80D|nr:YhcN/YlaJ family sporulation lipoprotein [Bacillus tuaregi]
MHWKALLTTISISSIILSACGTDNGTALNPNPNTNQDTAHLRTVSDKKQNVNQSIREEQNRRITNGNGNNQNRDITARNIANNTADNDNGNATNNQMDIADQAAEKITQMREVDRANVIVTNHNAYVAAKLAANADKTLTNDVERKISDLVKSSNRNIEHVYISVNPDFYKRTTSYAEDIRNGQPVEGLFDEFSVLVRRVFPSKK